MPGKEQLRAFIAMELPVGLRKELARIQNTLKEEGPSPVKWVNPENIHLSLRFLGNIDGNVISKISGAIKEAAQGISPLHFELGGLGVFPDLRRVQVIWIGLDGDMERLSRLQKRIDMNLVSLGFMVESRPFKPHLTLARVSDRAASDERQGLGQLIISNQFKEDYRFNVDSIKLIKSHLTREGAIYSIISSVNLQE